MPTSIHTIIPENGDFANTGIYSDLQKPGFYRDRCDGRKSIAHLGGVISLKKTHSKEGM